MADQLASQWYATTLGLGETEQAHEVWVNLQAQYDLWRARETDLGGVGRLVSA